jgi:protein required for attachment to host cells
MGKRYKTETNAMKPTRTWVLVADGKHGRILKQIGPLSHLEAMAGEIFEQTLHKTSEIGTDRPGRVHESVGGAHHAMAARVDWHRAEKCDFARKLAAHLEDGAGHDEFDRLILVAPPRTLGELRATLGPCARGRLAGDLDKDLTDSSPDDIEARLVKAALL